MNLATNATNDPVLKTPEFGCVLSGTKGEYRPHLDEGTLRILEAVRKTAAQRPRRGLL
jgi:hypothetical protein